MNSALKCLGLMVLAAAPLLPGQTTATAAVPPIRVGGVFPLRGPMSPLARQEYMGVQIARALVNAQGGVRGHQIQLVTRELYTPDGSASAMKSLRRAGVPVVLGAYSSALSLPASAAAAAQGLVYWEAGAVADRLTGRGLPSVFRVGASGSNLGANSANFAAQQLATRLHKPVAAIRISIVYANDAYATSVANAATRAARARGMRIVSQTAFDPYGADWSPAIRAIRALHPDILILASHIPDGVAFRRAFLAAHLHVGAFIGSTMAQCVPEFGALLGKDAIGVFASDRPGTKFNPRALTGTGRVLYAELAARWRQQTGQAAPSEEALSGFSAAWALFHDVLPAAGRTGAITPGTIRAAADAVDVSAGSLPNGAGIKFARDAAHMGQNTRAAAVIWQWQAVRTSVVVWPTLYKTGTIRLVPLPR